MHRISTTLPAPLQEHDIAMLSEGLFDEALAQTALRQDTHRGPWNVEWIVEIVPDLDAASLQLGIKAEILGLDLGDVSWTTSIIDTDTDWLAESYRAFPPFSVGPFFIYGTHYADNTDWSGVPDGQMGLQIDAATAFGSGEHGTTKGCLQAMLNLKGGGICPWNVLDMGTGSGILAVAAWKLWKTPIAAVDIDKESVRVTERHANLNGVKISQGALSLAAGNGFATPLAQDKKPYELVIANILAGPLIEMAADLAAVVDKPGYVILSGMLTDQAADVLAAYQVQGLTLKDRYDIDDWSTLVLTR